MPVTINSINYTTAVLTNPIYVEPADYEIIPYASYVAIGCVVVFAFFIIIARLVIRVDGQQSDLILFNKSPQKHLLLLVSKQLYNTTAAQNNIASAIAHGLMEAPANYDSSKLPTPVNNTNKTIGYTNIAMSDSVSTKTSTTTINSMSKFDSVDSIEPLNKGSSKRQKW